MTTKATESDLALIAMALRSKAEADRALAESVATDDAKLAAIFTEQAKRADQLAEAAEDGELGLDEETRQ